MKFPLINKKPIVPKKPSLKRPPPIPPKSAIAHKRMLLTEPNTLIGYRIDDGHIKLMSVLGVGGNGVVYHAIECDPDSISQPIEPNQFAVKVLSKVGLEARQLRNLEREFEIHALVSGHEHIVGFHGIVEEEDFFFILLEYVPGGDIFDRMELHKAYVGNDELIKSVFLQLIDAVQHIHDLGVSHRDIKPENILCKDDGSHMLLADFGLGTDRKVVRDYGVGSEPYMAPQCFGGFWQKLGPYSAPHADIWSLGVVLVNLACARNPWHKATEESSIYREYINNPNYLLEILPISRDLNEILKRMFTINPQARISLGELKEMVEAIPSFTLTEEELRRASPTVRFAVKRADEQKQPKLTPGAPHTLVARQITNLTAEDIGRLESEARADAREAALRLEESARCSASLDDVNDAEDDEEETAAYLMSPPLSPTITLVLQEATPRIGDVAILNNDAIPVPNEEEADSGSDSDSDSEGPITPESHPIADEDIDVASVPEITLDAECELHEEMACLVLSSKTGRSSVHQHEDMKVPQVGQVEVPRTVWWI